MDHAGPSVKRLPVTVTVQGANSRSRIETENTELRYPLVSEICDAEDKLYHIPQFSKINKVQSRPVQYRGILSPGAWWQCSATGASKWEMACLGTVESRRDFTVYDQYGRW
jgi:hypothetical protein